MIKKLGTYLTDCTDPYRNLAVEEYLTLHVQPGECILYLWQNQKTVVIGKNQNCWKECKVNDLERDGGHLVRRLSGGGAVYHDMGNLNFTFCVRKENYDVDRQLSVIVEAVRSFGLDAEKTGRNDITAGGRKFSGNAFYRSGVFCYHHGTLLVSADMQQMGKYLNVSKQKLQSNGVDSVRSRVVNLRELEKTVTIEALEDRLQKAFAQVYGCKAEPLREEELDWNEIRKSEQRFSSWDWKYGRKIPFQYSAQERFSWGEAELQFYVDGGIVREVNVFSDGMEQEFLSGLEKVWTGCRYEEQALLDRLLGLPKTDPLQIRMEQDIEELIKKVL